MYATPPGNERKQPIKGKKEMAARYDQPLFCTQQMGNIGLAPTSPFPVYRHCSGGPPYVGSLCRTTVCLGHHPSTSSLWQLAQFTTIVSVWCVAGLWETPPALPQPTCGRFTTIPGQHPVNFQQYCRCNQTFPHPH